ncbi:unnamed protein product, partial [Meganyctiphanes norvegica]
ENSDDSEDGSGHYENDAASVDSTVQEFTTELPLTYETTEEQEYTTEEQDYTTEEQDYTTEEQDYTTFMCRFLGREKRGKRCFDLSYRYSDDDGYINEWGEWVQNTETSPYPTSTPYPTTTTYPTYPTTINHHHIPNLPNHIPNRHHIPNLPNHIPNRHHIPNLPNHIPNRHHIPNLPNHIPNRHHTPNLPNHIPNHHPIPNHHHIPNHYPIPNHHPILNHYHHHPKRYKGWGHRPKLVMGGLRTPKYI